jgi:cobalt-zinc-cadmium efflux system membrane fusion protein
MVSAKLAAAIFALVIITGGATVWISPEAPRVLASLSPVAQGVPSKDSAERGHAHGREGAITLTAAQVARAKIELAAVENCTITQRLTVPGTITLDADRTGRVAAKVVGTVAELRKRLRDPVIKNEVVAVLESREVADARSDYIVAAFHFDLQKTLFEREQQLYEKKISSETQFLRTRNTFLEAELRVNIARQKLVALGLGETEIASLSTHQTANLRQIELRAPVAGQIVERRVDLGAPVGREGQENEIYVIADLSSLWVELTVPTADLATISDGQPVTITTGPNGPSADAKIIFVSPLLHTETRSARVIAAMDNTSMRWRPGIFVTAHIATAEQQVDLCVARSALQTMDGEQVLFVRTKEGFEKREVVVGRGDDVRVEIVFGLDPGEVIAVSKTFVLKAELGKGEAGHDHAH